MKCPACKAETKAGETIYTETKNSVRYLKCRKCKGLNAIGFWEEDSEEDFRPSHYKKGNDTFSWANHKFDLETNLAICRFNIHKYNDREKGQDVEDFEKIIAYAQRALDLIKDDKQEVTFDD